MAAEGTSIVEVRQLARRTATIISAAEVVATIIQVVNTAVAHEGTGIPTIKPMRVEAEVAAIFHQLIQLSTRAVIINRLTTTATGEGTTLLTHNPP